jgi:hypothetical protein
LPLGEVCTAAQPGCIEVYAVTSDAQEVLEALPAA